MSEDDLAAALSEGIFTPCGHQPVTCKSERGVRRRHIGFLKTNDLILQENYKVSQIVARLGLYFFIQPSKWYTIYMCMVNLQKILGVLSF